MAVTFDAKSAPPSGQKTVDHRARDLRQALLECLLVIPAVALLEFGFYYLASALGWQPAAIKLAAGGIVLATAAGMIAGIFFPQVRKTVWQALAPILLAQVILLIGDALADGLGLNKYLMCLAVFAIFMVASILAGAFHRPEGRQLVWQALLIVLIVLLFEMIIFNTVASLKKANIASGFDFYRDTAKFDIGQSLIEYSATSTYARAFWVGLLNTLLVAAIGIVLATLLGFVMGIARLSTNWLVARLATVYVETVRNLPLLLQLFFWYIAVLKSLPEVADSRSLTGTQFGLVIASALLMATAIFTAIAASGWVLKRAATSIRLEGNQPLVMRIIAGVVIYAGIALVGWLLIRLLTGLPVNLKLGLSTLFLPVLELASPTLPTAETSLQGAAAILNNRGLFVVRPVLTYGVELATIPVEFQVTALRWVPPFDLPVGLKRIGEPGHEWLFAAFLAAIVLSIVIAGFARRRQEKTGQRFPVLWTTWGLLLGLPLIAYFIVGKPIPLSYPKLDGFNFAGGLEIIPEFLALLLGLVFYTGGYIAEIVRAGIAGVVRGQKEAGLAIGLSNGQVLRLVVIPQALRIIIPPLTSQYLNLTKNSSLAVAIAYPDLVSIFAGTVLNQTGQAVEAILVTMLVYLTFSLTTSMIMNWYNWKKQLVER